MKEFLMAAAFAALLAGCQDRGLTHPTPPQKTGVIYDDLPAPQHFTYTRNDSYQNPSGAWRVVNQVLEGSGQRVAGAAAFYQKTFPAKGWTLERTEGNPQSAVTYSFVNKEERCWVDIKDQSATVVVVTLKVDKKG